MFDIGFWELAVIAVVALLVVGPERLPGLVRSAGYWFGRARSVVSSVQAEVKRELHNAEVLRREAEEKAGLADLNKMIDPEAGEDHGQPTIPGVRELQDQQRRSRESKEAAPAASTDAAKNGGRQ